jgi:hypothetical protein
MTWELTAMGVAGEWQVELLRAESDENAWRLCAEGRLVNLSIEISGPTVVGELSRFFRGTEGRREHSEMAVGRCGGGGVVLVKDDEFGDRYFVRVGEGALVLTLAGEILADVRRAFGQVAAELGQG